MSQNSRKGVRSKHSQGSDSARGAERQQAARLSIRYLFDLHKKTGKEAFCRLMKTPVASVMNGLMIAVAFTLPVLLYLLVINLQIVSNSWDGQPGVSVYLDEGIKQQRVDDLIKLTKEYSIFEQVDYISPDQGLADFQQKASIASIASELGFNPLPGVIQLIAYPETSYHQLDAFVTSFEKRSGVDQVRLDRQWVQRLQAILTLLERVVYTLGALLGLTVLLVISNTIRLNIESRREEIRIIKMVGGTDGFVTMPFLYMGVWYGLLGAIMAQVMILVVMTFLGEQILSLVGLYQSSMTIQEPGFSTFLTMMITGVFLGVMGAVVSCYRHLRTLRPV